MRRLGLRPYCTPRALTAFLPSWARFTIRSRSSWASALRKASTLSHRAGQIQVRLVENLRQGSTGSDAQNDLDAVEHRSCCPTFRQHHHVLHYISRREEIRRANTLATGHNFRAINPNAALLPA